MKPDSLANTDFRKSSTVVTESLTLETTFLDSPIPENSDRIDSKIDKSHSLTFSKKFLRFSMPTNRSIKPVKNSPIDDKYPGTFAANCLTLDHMPVKNPPIVSSASGIFWITGARKSRMPTKNSPIALAALGMKLTKLSNNSLAFSPKAFFTLSQNALSSGAIPLNASFSRWNASPSFPQISRSRTEDEILSHSCANVEICPFISPALGPRPKNPRIDAPSSENHSAAGFRNSSTSESQSENIPDS